MLLFPNCKINLGLYITHKRDDGYHDLETVFYPILWQDALEAIKTGIGLAQSNIQFNATGLPVKGLPENNLCVKAWHLLKKDFPELPGIQMHLHKVIPMGAGLGGGSSDGAFALKLINEVCHLQLSVQQLHSYALQLGSDCPFFILNQSSYASGRGENLEPVSLDLSDYRMVIVHPNIHVSTSQAFEGVIPKIPDISIKEIISQPVSKWKDILVNDFEKTVFSRFPQIKEIKDLLYQNKAVYASMSGSGSAVFGLFEKKNPNLPNFPPGYTVFQTK